MKKNKTADINKIFLPIAYEKIHGYPPQKEFNLKKAYWLTFMYFVLVILFFTLHRWELISAFPSLLLSLLASFIFVSLLGVECASSSLLSKDILPALSELKTDYRQVAHKVTPEEFAEKALEALRLKRVAEKEQAEREIYEKYGLDQRKASDNS